MFYCSDSSVSATHETRRERAIELDHNPLSYQDRHARLEKSKNSTNGHSRYIPLPDAGLENASDHNCHQHKVVSQSPGTRATPPWMFGHRAGLNQQLHRQKFQQHRAMFVDNLLSAVLLTQNERELLWWLATRPSGSDDDDDDDDDDSSSPSETATTPSPDSHPSFVHDDNMATYTPSFDDAIFIPMSFSEDEVEPTIPPPAEATKGLQTLLPASKKTRNLCWT